ncbi:Anaphase-promoting complex subunit 15/MND2 [Penicillium taxi]|uniref:Anaphase-promoting complex subunit 15/MND2 n=1 Tax=Penicillium taxi TaxID=168475 RepID=UPI0025455682|nr:Anaphase-promoting complex subunit 15/MND2 [Penicillium taxi]KAJ5888837.1 Anaphase-promoting complex subunit 15/MND2 [Penicillium taxi]
MWLVPSIGPDLAALYFGDESTQSNSSPSRRNGDRKPIYRGFAPPRRDEVAECDELEHSIRIAKHNIATFGYTWIVPAGCTKTMQQLKEEEVEREEAMLAAQAEMNAQNMMEDAEGMEGEEDEIMERDLDEEIPDADVEGLIEDGEEGLEEEDDEGYMERDLDDDFPEGYAGDEYEESGIYDEEYNFDDQPDLDAEIPEDTAELMSEGMSQDLDADISDASDGLEQEGEWQHTDTEDEFDESVVNVEAVRAHFRTSTPNSRGPLSTPPVREETEAQRRFLQRWSGGGDTTIDSSLLYDDDNLRASVTSQGSQRSLRSPRSPRSPQTQVSPQPQRSPHSPRNGFSRRFPRHVGGPRDSLT